MLTLFDMQRNYILMRNNSYRKNPSLYKTLSRTWLCFWFFYQLCAVRIIMPILQTGKLKQRGSMNVSPPCSFWVLALETMLCASFTHFCNLAAWIFVCQRLVACMEKSRSLWLDLRTHSYLSLCYSHSVLLHYLPIWIKSFNLPVPSCIHTLPCRAT